MLLRSILVKYSLVTLSNLWPWSCRISTCGLWRVPVDVFHLVLVTTRQDGRQYKMAALLLMMYHTNCIYLYSNMLSVLSMSVPLPLQNLIKTYQRNESSLLNKRLCLLIPWENNMIIFVLSEVNVYTLHSFAWVYCSLSLNCILMCLHGDIFSGPLSVNWD